MISPEKFIENYIFSKLHSELLEVENYIVFLLRSMGPMQSEALINIVKNKLDCSKNSIYRALKRLTRENGLICRAPSDWSNRIRTWYCYYTDTSKMLLIQGLALGIIYGEVIFYNNNLSYVICIEPKQFSKEAVESCKNYYSSLDQQSIDV